MTDCFARWWEFCQRPENDGRRDDTADDGAGLTRWGWTFPVWRQATAYDRGRDLSRAAFEAMDAEEARTLSQAWFWERLKADEMPPGVNISVIDFCWTSGAAVSEIQAMLNVPADGVVGRVTLEALNGAPAAGLIQSIYMCRLDYYNALALRPRFPGLWTRAAACKALSLACLAS